VTALEALSVSGGTLAPVTSFLALHRPGDPLLLPNAWDVGSARLFAAIGFQALASTSSGAAAAVGRLDGALGRDAALAHSAGLVAATDLPVSADLENGFADDPAGVVDTVAAARAVGLAGLSIEDASGRGDEIYRFDHAVERIAAAAEAAHAGTDPLVLTARAENFLHGRADLKNTIARLQAYADAGADVVYAPGITGIDEVREVVAAVDVPVNVLMLPGLPPVAELAAAGVARISVGGAFTFLAYGAALEAAQAFRRGDLDWVRNSRERSAGVQQLLRRTEAEGG
jgi:2-methylisocitrate lyase-like PEP mutase family enzyme